MTIDEVTMNSTEIDTGFSVMFKWCRLRLFPFFPFFLILFIFHFAIVLRHSHFFEIKFKNIFSFFFSFSIFFITSFFFYDQNFFHFFIFSFFHFSFFSFFSGNQKKSNEPQKSQLCNSPTNLRIGWCIGRICHVDLRVRRKCSSCCSASLVIRPIWEGERRGKGASSSEKKKNPKPWSLKVALRPPSVLLV